MNPSVFLPITAALHAAASCLLVTGHTKMPQAQGRATSPTAEDSPAATTG
jgi:hypothetical protein